MKRYDPNDSVRGDGKFPELDAFLDVLEEKQKNHVSPQNVNVIKYREFQECLKGLSEIVLRMSPDAKIDYTLNDELDTGSAVIEIMADELSVVNITRFIESIKNANSFAVYPIGDDKVSISVSFHGMMT